LGCPHFSGIEWADIAPWAITPKNNPILAELEIISMVNGPSKAEQRKISDGVCEGCQKPGREGNIHREMKISLKEPESPGPAWGEAGKFNRPFRKSRSDELQRSEEALDHIS
jgi:hypothetical protein